MGNSYLFPESGQVRIIRYVLESTLVEKWCYSFLLACDFLLSYTFTLLHFSTEYNRDKFFLRSQLRTRILTVTRITVR
jgi:hypothetical protein